MFYEKQQLTSGAILPIFKEFKYNKMHKTKTLVNMSLFYPLQCLGLVEKDQLSPNGSDQEYQHIKFWLR